MLFKNKYWIYFIHRESNSFTLQYKKQIKAGITQYRFKGNTYLIDMAVPTYIIERKLIYLVNIKSGKQYVLSRKDATISPKVIDELVSQNIFKQFIATLERDSAPIPYAFIIMAALLGGVVGYLISQYV